MRAILVLVLMLACFAQAPTAFAAPLFGFNDHAVQWKQVSASEDARLAADAGASTSRIAVDWNYVQPGPEYWIWDVYDAIYNAQRAKGIRPIFQLAFAPPWAWPEGTKCKQDCLYPPGPEHLDDWGGFAAAVATRYPELAAIEIWNEPNLSRYWQPLPDPAYYTAVVRAANDAIKAAGSTTPVVAGAMANDPLYDTADRVSPRTFLGKMYGAGFEDAADGISIHAYPNDVDHWMWFKTLTEIRDVRDYHDEKDHPLWITETGTSTTGSSPASLGDYGQAVVMPRVYGLMRQMPDVSAVLVHTLIEPDRYPASSLERGLGLLDTSLNPKPGYCAFAAANGTSYACPNSVVMPAGNTTQDTRWEAQELLQRAADAARVYHETAGTYAGITSAALHAIDPAISAIPALASQKPGSTADPSKVNVSSTTVNGTSILLVCNASRADRAHCIRNPEWWRWTYGSWTGSIGAAATAIQQGKTDQW